MTNFINALTIFILAIYYSVTPVHPMQCDPMLKDMVMQFKHETKDFNHNNRLVSIEIDYELDSLGICTQDRFGIRRVKILPPHKLKGFATMKAVLFHELAHCLLEVDHSAELILMQEFLPVDQRYWMLMLPVAMLELRGHLEKRKRFTPLGGMR